MMVKPLHVLRRFAANRKGAAMVEYALLAALIAVVAITTLTTLGTNVNAKFNAISTKL